MEEKIFAEELLSKNLDDTEEYWVLVFEYKRADMPSPNKLHYHVKGNWASHHIELSKHCAEEGIKYTLINRFQISKDEFTLISKELADFDSIIE